MPISKVPAAIVGVIYFAAVPSTVQAVTYIANTNAGSGTLHSPGPTNVSNKNGPTPVTSSSSSLADNSITESAKAFSTSTAKAETGAVHAVSTARANTFATGCCTSALGQTSAYAEFNDQFVVQGAGLANGTLATLTGTVLINGNTPSLYSGQFWGVSAFWRATNVIGGTFNVLGYSLNGDSTNGFTTTGSNSFGLFTFSADVLIGQMTNFVLRLETSAQANAGGFGSNVAEQSANLQNTFSWQGIGSLTVGGHRIDDFSAKSLDSGFDYRLGLANVPAVPEPASWAMMLIGFGVVGGAMRSRRRVSVSYG